MTQTSLSEVSNHQHDHDDVTIYDNGYFQQAKFHRKKNFDRNNELINMVLKMLANLLSILSSGFTAYVIC